MDVRGRVSSGYYVMPPQFKLVTDHAMLAYGYRGCVIFNVSNRGERLVTSIQMLARNRGNYSNCDQISDTYFILTR